MTDIQDRTNEAARAGVLMTAANARHVLREMESQVKSATKRRRMAAFYATNVAGKLSPEAVAVYRDYASA